MKLASLLLVTLLAAVEYAYASAPVVAWTNRRGLFVPNKDGKYHVVHEEVSGHVLLGLLDDLFLGDRTHSRATLSESVDRPDVIVMLKNPESDGVNSQTPPASKRGASLNSSASGMVLSHVRSTPDTDVMQNLKHLSERDARMTDRIIFLGCDGARTSHSDLARLPGLLEKISSASSDGVKAPLPALLFLCTSGDHVADDIVLEELKDKVLGQRSYVVFDGSFPTRDEQEQQQQLQQQQQQRRRLEGASEECGPRCQSQVAFAEGLIIILLVLATIGFGMLMLANLQGPSKFEVPHAHND